MFGSRGLYVMTNGTLSSLFLYMYIYSNIANQSNSRKC